MPRTHHRRPPLQPVLIMGHGCLWPRCPERCRPGQIMDGPHWETLPWALRRKFRDAKREGVDTQAYADALAEITTWARRRDLLTQGAGAR